MKNVGYDERLWKKCFELEEVRFTELKTGLKGIAIGCEDLFLAVDYNFQHLAVKLLDIYDFIYPLTGWFFLKKPSDLRKTKYTPIHMILAKKYGIMWPEILERIIAELENHVEILEDVKPEFWRCPKCKVTWPLSYVEKSKYRCPRCGEKLYPR